MAQLQSTNVVGTLCVNGIAIGGGKDFKFCCFTGSDNWTPSSDLATDSGNVEVTLVGGGGGGGWSKGCAATICSIHAIAGAGGGGEVISKLKTITSTDACCHVIGAGGAAAANRDEAGAVGGDTTFLGYTAYGGGGGGSACCFGAIANTLTNPNFNGHPAAPQVACAISNDNGCYQTYLNSYGYWGAVGAGDAQPLPFSWCQKLVTYTCPQGPINTGILGTPTTTSGSIQNWTKWGGVGPDSFGQGGAVDSKETFQKREAYGKGGHGNHHFSCRCNSTTAQTCQGGDGNQGIVILKWAE